jgi:hypothetical protein
MCAQNYDDIEDDTVEAKATKGSKAPSLDDVNAFPEAEWGVGSGSAASKPAGGKSLAELASETLPSQRAGIDLNAPIVIKMPRPPTKTRIQKVREIYKKDDRKKFNHTFTVYHDEGIPAGMAEKKAPLEMDEVGSVENLKDFEKVWANTVKLPRDDGSNIRVFRSEFVEPAPEHEALVKGGKYQIRVSKELTLARFEELCIYLFDNRLDLSIVGVCWCLRPNFDLVQLWTKTPQSAAAVEVLKGKLAMLLGAKPELSEVTYDKHQDKFVQKTAKSRRFYLAEPQVPTGPGAIMSVDTVIQMREYGSKKKKEGKTDKDDFTEIAGTRTTKQSKSNKPKEVAANEPVSPRVPQNNNDLLDDDNTVDDAEEGGDDIQLYEKKKSEKTRKGSTRKGSKKEKKSKEDYELPPSAAPLIPQQIFVGAGLGGILFVAMLAIFMSGLLN